MFARVLFPCLSPIVVLACRSNMLPMWHNLAFAQVGPNLNHDEIVVYKDAAAIPTHLIVYSTA